MATKIANARAFNYDTESLYKRDSFKPILQILGKKDNENTKNIYHYNDGFQFLNTFGDGSYFRDSARHIHNDGNIVFSVHHNGWEFKFEVLKKDFSLDEEKTIPNTVIDTTDTEGYFEEAGYSRIDTKNKLFFINYLNDVDGTLKSYINTYKYDYEGNLDFLGTALLGDNDSFNEGAVLDTDLMLLIDGRGSLYCYRYDMEGNFTPVNNESIGGEAMWSNIDTKNKLYFVYSSVLYGGSYSEAGLSTPIASSVGWGENMDICPDFKLIFEIHSYFNKIRIYSYDSVGTLTFLREETSLSFSNLFIFSQDHKMILEKNDKMSAYSYDSSGIFTLENEENLSDEYHLDIVPTQKVLL